MSEEERDDLEAFPTVLDMNVNFSLEPISNSEESFVIDLQPRQNSFTDTDAGSSHMYKVSCEIYICIHIHAVSIFSIGFKKMVFTF